MKHSTTLDSVVESRADVSLEKPKRALTKPVVFATLTACLGSISLGNVLGYTAPVQNDLRNRLNWNDEQMSWFTSIPALGAMLGAIIGSYTTDRFGRKFSIMMCSLPFVVGWVLIAGANITSLIYVGRFVTGAAMGAISFNVPRKCGLETDNQTNKQTIKGENKMYIGEISPAKYRGALASGHQLCISSGLFLSFCLGVVLKWRWFAITCAVPAATMAILMISFPETPRWLIMNGKTNEACHALMYLRGTSYEECEAETKEIQSTLETDERISLRDFKKPAIYRSFIISIILMTFRQFCGINAVLSYVHQMLDDAGISNANVAEVAIAVLLMIGSAISCVVIDKLGRRMLLIFPSSLMCVSMVVLGTAKYFNGFPSSVTLISLCLYTLGFASGLGPISWVVMAEILPTRARGFASGITTQLGRFSSFIVMETYVSMTHAMHSYGVYWFYAAVCLLSAVYVFVCLPETKEKTLEEVEVLFAHKRGLILDGKACTKYGATRTCIS